MYWILISFSTTNLCIWNRPQRQFPRCSFRSVRRIRFPLRTIPICHHRGLV